MLTLYANGDNVGLDHRNGCQPTHTHSGLDWLPYRDSEVFFRLREDSFFAWGKLRVPTGLEWNSFFTHTIMLTGTSTLMLSAGSAITASDGGLTLYIMESGSLHQPCLPNQRVFC